jgi:hypothetical protein
VVLFELGQNLANESPYNVDDNHNQCQHVGHKGAADGEKKKYKTTLDPSRKKQGKRVDHPFRWTRMKELMQCETTQTMRQPVDSSIRRLDVLMIE